MDAYAVNDWDELEAAFFGKSTGTYGYEPEPAYAHMQPSADGYIYQGAPSEVPSRSIPDRKTKKKTEEQRKHHQELLAAYKTKERYISVKRFREGFAVAVGIAVVAGMFGFILFRQAQITTLNFQNNAAQRRISALNEETVQIEESLVANADLTQIRWDAMERLGM